MSKSWREEFDEKFVVYTGTKRIGRVGYFTTPSSEFAVGHDPKLIKAFIQDLLDRKAREIAEHGYRKNEPGWEKISTEVKFYGMGYNDGLSQALGILKEEE